MQRLPCWRACGLRCCTNSRWWRRRSSTRSLLSSMRANSKKPVIFPMMVFLVRCRARAASCAVAALACCVLRARRYSWGKTLTKRERTAGHCASSAAAWAEPVSVWCCCSRRKAAGPRPPRPGEGDACGDLFALRVAPHPGPPGPGCSARQSCRRRRGTRRPRRRTCQRQSCAPWPPAPARCRQSLLAAVVAGALHPRAGARQAHRQSARPPPGRKKARPEVAPYSAVLRRMMFCAAFPRKSACGRTAGRRRTGPCRCSRWLALSDRR